MKSVTLDRFGNRILTHGLVGYKRGCRCFECRSAAAKACKWPSLRDRLFSRLVLDPSGCLLWTGHLDYHGYGRMHAAGNPAALVHKVMWELFVGPVPDGFELDHVKAWGCNNKNCASIAHLEPVTHRENILRGNTVTAINAAKTHCIRDHPFDEENTFYEKDGRRGCIKCRRIRDRARRRRGKRPGKPITGVVKQPPKDVA
jgi:HNH endonuclease